jgi:hypothetical protein
VGLKPEADRVFSGHDYLQLRRWRGGHQSGVPQVTGNLHSEWLHLAFLARLSARRQSQGSVREP